MVAAFRDKGECRRLLKAMIWPRGGMELAVGFLYALRHLSMRDADLELDFLFGLGGREHTVRGGLSPYFLAAVSFRSRFNQACFSHAPAWLEGCSVDQRLAPVSLLGGWEATALLVVAAELQSGTYPLRV